MWLSQNFEVLKILLLYIPKLLFSSQMATILPLIFLDNISLHLWRASFLTSWWGRKDLYSLKEFPGPFSRILQANKTQGIMLVERRGFICSQQLRGLRVTTEKMRYREFVQPIWATYLWVWGDVTEQVLCLVNYSCSGTWIWYLVLSC